MKVKFYILVALILFLSNQAFSMEEDQLAVLAKNMQNQIDKICDIEAALVVTKVYKNQPELTVNEQKKLDDEQQSLSKEVDELKKNLLTCMTESIKSAEDLEKVFERCEELSQGSYKLMYFRDLDDGQQQQSLSKEEGQTPILGELKKNLLKCMEKSLKMIPEDLEKELARYEEFSLGK